MGSIEEYTLLKPKSDPGSSTTKATSRSQGKIGQNPKEPMTCHDMTPSDSERWEPFFHQSMTVMPAVHGAGKGKKSTF